MLVKADVIKKADELNRMAAKLLPLPKGLTQAEQLLYKSLCIVYREFRAGQIDKKQALDEKQELYRAYINGAYALDLWQTYGEYAKVFQKHQYEIHHEGCEVCKRLNDILCGMGRGGANETH